MANVRWIGNIRRQCHEQGVKCFIKQLGTFPIVNPCRQHHWDFGGEIGRTAKFSALDKMHPSSEPWRVHLKDRKGGNMDEWPLDLRVREFPK